MVNDIVLSVVVIFFLSVEPSLAVESDEVDILRHSRRVNILKHSTCGSKLPGTDVLLCHCDELCTHYKDCCYSQNASHLNEAADLKDEVHRTECAVFPGDLHSYLMHNVAFAISRIPVSAKIYIKACQYATKTNPFEGIPVYSFQVKAHFSNYFCLKLFNRIRRSRYDPESVAMWSVSLPGDCLQKYFKEFSVKKVFGTYMEFLSLVFSRKYCNLTLVPPKSATARICFQQNLDGCKDHNVCESYQSPVTDEIGILYKNAHCAECSGSHVISNLDDGKAADDRKSLLTLHRLSVGFGPYVEAVLLSAKVHLHDPCWIPSTLKISSTGLGCNLTCPDDQMRYFNTCINPIAKVRGFLQQVEVKTSSSKSLPLDQKEKITRAVLDMIDPIADFFVTSKVVSIRAKSSGCLHIVKIAIYLRYDVIYRDYLNISKYIREFFGNRKKGLENEILNMTMNGEPCIPVGTSNIDWGSALRQTAMTDTIRVIIFSSIFGVFVVAIVAVTVIKGIMNKLTRNHETEANE